MDSKNDVWQTLLNNLAKEVPPAVIQAWLKPKEHKFLENKKYTFDNFAVGDSNCFAGRVAQSVAENLGINTRIF